MKYLVYLLIVLNLAYFAWQRTRPPVPVPAPQLAPLPSGVEPLVLLSERKRTRPPAMAVEGTPDQVEPQPGTATEPAKPVPVETESPVRVEVTPVCRTVGPITAPDEAASLRDRLSERGYLAVLREGEIQVPAGYQIYLPAMPSGQAREIVGKLEAAGMTDYFVGRHNRISLGIFSSKGKARVRQRAVQALGYDAVLDARYRTRKVYWIDFQDTAGSPEQSADWRQVLASYPELKAQQVSCE